MPPTIHRPSPLAPSQVPSWRLTAPPGLSLAAARQRDGRAPAVGTAADRDAAWAAAMSPELGRIIRPTAVPRWILPSLSVVTPAYIENVLRHALAGDHAGQAELFALMEDTWPRLSKNLNELKRAVVRLDWDVEAWAEDDVPPSPRSKARAKLVSHAIWRMKPAPDTDEDAFPGLVYDLLDAWAKGLSVVEILWEWQETATLGGAVLPRATCWVDPQSYVWGENGQLLLRTDGGSRTVARIAQGEPMPEHKFLIARGKARSGHPLAGALLRPLAWWWCASNFSADWLLNLGQIFGLPYRWTNYASGASEATINAVCDALENMGSAGWAAFPEGTTMQLVESTKSSTAYPQSEILDRADTQCDLLILGQTLTTDVRDSGSRALGDVHMDVRTDVIMAAAEFVEGVLNTQLVPAILALNFGETEDAPEIEGKPHKVEDRKANAERDQILMAAGVQMPRKWLYERHDIPLPQEGEETIGAPAPAPYDPPASSDPSSPAPRPPSTPPVSAAASVPSAPPDPTDAEVAETRSALATVYSGAMAPFREAVLASTSREDALQRLSALYRDWNPERLTAEIEDAIQVLAARGCTHAVRR